MQALKSWKVFEQVSNAKLIASSIHQLPSHWSLTPLQDKSPKREHWQTESFIPHQTIAKLILRGEETLSKRTGKPYRRYWSGFGLRTGEASGGLLAIDVDGVSAQPLLDAISDNELPKTVSWTSGKPGRYQLAFQVPSEIRPKLEKFTRRVVTQWQGLETAKDESGRPCELLEFRYNYCQSALPPSRHPDTGAYKWINSPKDTPVAIAPDWLCNLLLSFADEEVKELEQQAERIKQVEKRKQARKLNPVSSNSDNLSNILDQSLARLRAEDIFNWSGHDWAFQGRDKWVGYCPRHNSKSGKSFQVNPNTFNWYCFGCETGGHAVQYLHFLNGGKGTPKSKDFVEIVKGLADNAGIVIQHSNSREYVPYSNSEIKFRIKRDNFDVFLKDFPNLETEAGKEWLELRKFTPDETINSEYFYCKPPKKGELVAGNSGLGTGKSYYINEHCVGKNDGAIALGNRNTTLIQFVENAQERHNRTWHHIQQDLKGSRDDLRLIQDPQSKIIGCIDSILYVHEQDAVDKKIVLDEVESTTKHLCYSSTAVSYQREACKHRLSEIESAADSLVMLDGNLKNITVSYHEKLSGKKGRKVKNLFQGNRGKVTLYNGSEKFKQNKETGKWEQAERRLDDCSLLRQTMLNDPDPKIIGSDSQEQLETWDKQLKDKGRRTFRLDGTTSNTLEGKKFIRNPQQYIQENQIEDLLYSPSADQGLSIDLKGYFKRGYFFFFGVVLTDTQIQFLGRLRDADCHLHVFCQVKHRDANSLNHDLLSDGIKSFGIEIALECAKASLQGLDKEAKAIRLARLLIEKSDDVHYEYECQLLAMARFEQNNLRNCLEYAMRDAGWQVEVVTGRKVEEKELAQIKDAIHTQRSEKFYTAPQITATEAQKIEMAGVTNEEDKAKLTRHRLLERIPGIEGKLITQKKVIRVPASEIAPENTAQKSGVLEAGMPIEQGLEPVHIPPSDINNYEGLCGQNQEGDENVANHPPEDAQSNTQQGLEPVHIPPSDTNNYEGLCGQERTDDWVEVEIEETRPIFDAEFIKRVKFKDRGLISQLENQFLLRNPDIAKQLQQNKWRKKLSLFVDENEIDGIKRFNLATYKSPWLRIATLIEMGLPYFLEPESAWTNQSPEAIEFWERGKDPKIARHIGLEVGDSDPCKYIGRVLDSFGVKREWKKITLPSGERVRQYQPKPLDPICQAIYECVESRILSALEKRIEALDWDQIIQKSEGLEAGTRIQQGLEPVHIVPGNINNHEGVCGQTAATERSRIEELAEALAYCETPDTFDMFEAGVNDYTRSEIEAAIAGLDKAHVRHQLTRWLDTIYESQLSQPTQKVESEPVESIESQHPDLASYTQGQEVLFYHPSHKSRWLKGVIESITNGLIRVKAIAGIFGRMIDRSDEILPLLA